MVPYWLALPVGVCIATIVTIVGFGELPFNGLGYLSGKA